MIVPTVPEALRQPVVVPPVPITTVRELSVAYAGSERALGQANDQILAIDEILDRAEERAAEITAQEGEP